MIVVFSWLTAAEISDAAWWIFEPHQHGMLVCGNVVSDPLYLELNLLGPLAFVSALGMTRLAPSLTGGRYFANSPSFYIVATLVVLLMVVRFFTLEYGLPMGRVWWLPSFAQRWLLGR